MTLIEQIAEHPMLYEAYQHLSKARDILRKEVEVSGKHPLVGQAYTTTWDAMYQVEKYVRGK